MDHMKQFAARLMAMHDVVDHVGDLVRLRDGGGMTHEKLQDALEDLERAYRRMEETP
jgi:hypothetical protein